MEKEGFIHDRYCCNNLITVPNKTVRLHFI